MSVQAGQGKLARASKELLNRWNDTKAVWRDNNSKQFEDKFLNPLMAKLRTTEKAMGHMTEVLSKLKRDCS